MKLLLHFKNGHRIFSDSGAIVAPHPMSDVMQATDLSKATDQELKSLQLNPHQDSLLEEIAKRR